MLTRLAAVGQDVLVRAAGFFDRVRQHRPVAEIAAVVHLLGHRDEQTIVPSEPGGINRDGAEGVVDDIVEKDYDVLVIIATRNREGLRTADYPIYDSARKPGHELNPIHTRPRAGRWFRRISRGTPVRRAARAVHTAAAARSPAVRSDRAAARLAWRRL
jgi:hypothetical protein